MTTTRGPVLITGGAGFIGANLADTLAARGRRVIVYDSLARTGVDANVAWLVERRGTGIIPVLADVRDRTALEAAVAESEEIVHLAAQVAVTKSLEDPVTDFAVNALGTLNLLEAARKLGKRSPIVFASTNKVYGDLGAHAFHVDGDRYRPSDETLASRGVDESASIDLQTPYGCSKGAGDQYVLEYARHFGLAASVLRMSCVYGPRQFGTEDQGWVAHFLKTARADQSITLFGDGRQVRDVLHVDDAVAAYVAVLEDMPAAAGRAFNLGGGPANAVSLLDMIGAIERLLGRLVRRRHAPARAGDQLYYVSNTERLREAVGWTPAIPWRVGLASLNRWLEESEAPAAPPAVSGTAA